MFFDMGIGELLIVFGPDRLPRAAAQAAQFLRQLRDQANAAKATIIEAADIDESTLRDLRDLDPRKALRDVAAPLQDMKSLADGTVRDLGNAAARPVKPVTARPPVAGDEESPAQPLPAESGFDDVV